jgi:hypothetical protein
LARRQPDASRALPADGKRALIGTRFATLRAAGERWTFELDPTPVSDFDARRGLAFDEDLGTSD